MAEAFKIGTRFNSFEEVKNKVEAYGKQTLTKFWRRDARTLANTRIVRHIDSNLIYYQVVFACTHGGRKFKSYGEGIRQSTTNKEDCPVHIRFKASEDGKALQVTSLEMNHNHDTSKEIKLRNRKKRTRQTINNNDFQGDKCLKEMYNNAEQFIEDEINKPFDLVYTDTEEPIIETKNNKSFEEVYDTEERFIENQDNKQQQYTVKDRIFQRKKKLKQKNSYARIFNRKKIELINLQIQQSKDEHYAKMKILDIELKIKEAELQSKLNNYCVL